MRIIFGGAEIGSNRTILESCGVRAMSISFARIVKRGMPKTKSWLVSERFDEDVLVVATPGVSETKNFGHRELEEFAANYQEWIIENEDRLVGFVEFDPPQLGPDWIRGQRGFWLEAGEKFWPVWNPEFGPQELLRLSAEFSEVGIPGDAVKSSGSQFAGQMRALSAQNGTAWHGIGVASPESLSQIPFTTATTLSWTSPMRRGETIVWDGNRLVRYPKNMKDQARPRYKAVIEKAGLDYEAIIKDDAKELTRLAIWSYQRLEENMNKKTPGNPFRVIEGGEDSQTLKTQVDNSDVLMTGMGGILFGDVDNSTTDVVQAESRVPAPRKASERAFLPVLSVSTKTVVEAGEDGRDTLKDVPILSSTGSSLRQCNTCFVASNCPAYTPNTECAFSLPVEVKTKDQLVALLNAIIEMQGSRVAFARFSEELNGGYPDPNVSQEIDRLFKLVGQMKDLEDNKEFFRMTVERSGGAGVLSSIFGDRAQVLKELGNSAMSEEQVTNVIKGAIE